MLVEEASQDPVWGPVTIHCPRCRYPIHVNRSGRAYCSHCVWTWRVKVFIEPELPHD